MPLKSLLGSLAIGLAACSAPSSGEPNSKNAAHCVAAFNYAAYWYAQGNKDERGIIEMKARALFELDKIKASGNLDISKQESIDLTKRYDRDGKRMTILLSDCIKVQNENGRFRLAIDRLLERAQGSE